MENLKMVLSWNEIKDRALKFSNEWIDEKRERAEKDTFWNEFFNVFGISRRRIASFEEPVKKLGNRQGFIDLFWKGMVIVEHKSKGKDLNRAYGQAVDYFPGLKENELPKYIIVSDFENIKLYDLEENSENEFHINDFYKNVKLFGFIAGYQKRTFKEEDPVNIKAAELMGKFHDLLKDSGYEGHHLEVYLVRLLFVLFADDTGIFEKDIFKEFIELKTNEDGSGLGALIAQFFQVLNTPLGKRLKNLDEHLNAFPYINGKLFEESLPIAAFDSNMRNILLEASALDWGQISPAIFGSLFQSVMNPEERRNLGAHYTSEKNILKLIKPLFLDELRAEFEKIKSIKPKLNEFHKKLSLLKFLDPACGCGNFLIITYRELRQLELEILRELYKKGDSFFDISDIVLINVDQFYGIEYTEFAARIAEVGLWLIDHQMNMKISEEFGQYFARLPLKKSAKIIHGNALRIDWNSLVEGSSLDITASQTNIIQVSEPIAHYQTINIYTKDVNIRKGSLPIEDKKWNIKNRGKVDYIFGNPPFHGHQKRNKEQQEDMKYVWSNDGRTGRLDYATCWYKKAAEYIQGTTLKVAFVTTNSVTQGEQPAILWHELKRYNINILFAHKTFKWMNKARGKAQVHVVIIGFGLDNPKKKPIYDYPNVNSDPTLSYAENINSYLINSCDISLQARGKNLSMFPEMFKGSQPTDGGSLVLSLQERDELIKVEPEAEKWIMPYIGAAEFINNRKRYCLWLKNISPMELNQLPNVLNRVKAVAESRAKSPTSSVRNYAVYPTLFTQDRQPSTDYLVVPEVSSEKRRYIPIGFLSSEIICSNKLQIIPNASFYLFGVLQSIMHMAWTKCVCGRMKSDISYSPAVYNNFPWPEAPSEKNKNRVKEKAQYVLGVRAEFPESSLADLYDPLTMPPKLVKAHQELDRSVDLCYRPQAFKNETARIEFLFNLYAKYLEQV